MLAGLVRQQLEEELPELNGPGPGEEGPVGRAGLAVAVGGQDAGREEGPAGAAREARRGRGRGLAGARGGLLRGHPVAGGGGRLLLLAGLLGVLLVQVGQLGGGGRGVAALKTEEENGR